MFGLGPSSPSARGARASVAAGPFCVRLRLSTRVSNRDCREAASGLSPCASGRTSHRYDVARGPRLRRATWAAAQVVSAVVPGLKTRPTSEAARALLPPALPAPPALVTG